jgi:hypothetical protein|tara:strand:- start:247 stop:477 length:231 start_codon:yes stop_codon:yes gene_type:complete
MCVMRRPKLPPPPEPLAPPATEVNIGENRKQKKKLKTVKTKVSRSGAKSGKQALKIPLQVGGTTSGSGANVYKPTP